MSELDEFYEPGKTTPPNTAWMITFADLLSLMLTFFVLLYSMKVITHADWEHVVKSLRQRLNPNQEVTEFQSTAERDVMRITRPEAENLDYLESIIREKIGKDTGRAVALRRLDDRLVISLASDLLFESGSAVLTPAGETTLNQVSDALGTLINRIEIDGHTDPNPIASREFPSNWELSIARAQRIARSVYASGYLRPVDVFGLADSRYDEITPRIGQDQRYRLARRVDIVIRQTEP